MPSTLEELAQICGATVKGDLACKINSIKTLKSAQKGDITFLSNRRYTNYLLDTKASAVILNEKDAANCSVNALITDNPYLSYAKIANHLYSKAISPAFIHETVTIGDNCCIAESVSIFPNVTIGNNIVIGEGSIIGSGSNIGNNVRIGRNSSLLSNVTLCHDITIGDDVILSPGVVIGSDGFGMIQENSEWLKIPQIGSVIIMDRVEIGSNTTIDRGAIEDTVIQAGVKIDNQVQVGHNVIIGENTAIAGCTGIAGSTIIGKRCQIGGAVAINGHIEITDDVIITGMSGVNNSIFIPGVYSSGIPITENKVWRRNIIRFKQLDKIIKKIMRRLDKG